MTVGLRHDDLRKRNRAMVIRSIRHAGQPSRTEIAGATGLSHSTISAISSDLISEGILIESRQGEYLPQRRGRPQVALSLNPQAAQIAAVELSLNSLSATLIDYAGDVVTEIRTRPSTLNLSRSDLTCGIISLVRQLLDSREGSPPPLLRIVVSVQGITDSASRSLLWSPITPHVDIRLADALEKACGVPVTVENDCNMAAVALRWRGSERYREDFIAIFLSHGIGMGLILKGDLFTGTQSSGGEFGHMIHRPDGALCRCGRRGCVEAYAGNYAIWRNATGGDEEEPPISEVDDETMQFLAARARERPGPEREAFRKAGEALGFGLGSLFALIDPAPICFVGVGTTAFDLMEPALREAIAKTAGGHHSTSISFDTVENEKPLIVEGCALRALTWIDEEIFAPGLTCARTDALALPSP